MDLSDWVIWGLAIVGAGTLIALPVALVIVIGDLRRAHRQERLKSDGD